MESTTVLTGEAATALGIAIGRDPLPSAELALAVVGTAPAETEPVVEPTPAAIPESVADIIARLDARNAEIARHSASVLTFERKRPPVSMIGRQTRSSRPMCLGCGYGVRKETRQIEVPGGVMHPNCAKVAAGALDATKVSARYLAAIVPLAQVMIAETQKALPAPAAEVTEVETSEPEVEVPSVEPPVEDQTTDLVEQAVAQSGKGKGRGRKNRSA